MAAAITYVKENYQRPLSYSDVAKEMGISPSYFKSMFKLEMHTTFVDYLTEVRIDAAKELLLTTDMSITQIALDIGFSSPNYFSSTFHKIVGTSAKEYRHARVVDQEGPAEVGEQPRRRQPLRPFHRAQTPGQT